MAILRNDTTVRSADGQTTSAIITAANIGNYGISTTSTYYIGTTQNVFNRASASQTLTGVSIDGNAATVTNGVYTTGAQTIGGTKTFSDGVVVNGATYYTFNKPTTTNYQTVALFGSTSGGLFLTTDSAIIGVGAYYNAGWIATATSGRHIDFAGGTFNFNVFSGATVGGTATWGSVATLNSSGTFSATGDFRAPIFYDSNNTSYYLDAASTSSFNALNLASTLAINGGDGIRVFKSPASSVTSQIYWANGANTIAYNWQIDENNYAAMWGYGGTAWAKLLTITSGGGVGIGTSTISQKLNISGNIMVAPASSSWAEGLSFTMPTASTWGGLRWRREVANNDGNHYVGYTGLDSTDDLVFGSNNGGTQINNNIRITKAGLVGIGTAPSQKFHVAGIGYSDTDFRAPIFYDSANTAYYLDPNSSSNLNNVTVAGTLTLTNIAKNSTAPIVINSGQSASLGLRVYYDMNLYNTLTFTDSAWNSQGAIFGSGGNVTINAATATTSFVKYAGYSQEGGSFRAPIFYDSDNTSYYIDAASTSSLNILNVASYIDVSTYIYLRNNLRMLNSAANGWLETIVRNSGSPYFQNSIDGGTFLASDVSENNNWLFQENVRGWGIFYFNRGTQSGQTFGSYTTIGAETFIIGQGTGTTMTSTWTGYNASSKVAIMLSNYSGYIWANDTIFSATGMRAPIFYDSDNTSYYIDPAAATSLNIAGQITTAKTSGTLLSIAGADTIGYNATASRGAYIKGTSTTYVYGSGVYYDGSSVRQMLYEDTWLNSKYFDSNGIIYSQTSMRAPIFYDYNDTNYYIDPASTSVLNRLKVDGGNFVNDYFQSISDFASGTLVTTDIDASGASGESFVMNVVGKSYSASASPFNFSVQGYLYNSTIINYSGLSLDSTGLSTIKIFNNGGFLCFWWARVSYWNAFEVSVRAYNSTKANYNRVTNVTDSTEPVGSKKVTVTLQSFLRADVSATNSVDLRAPIFYDSNDTGYYCDPASTSRLNILSVGTGAISITGAATATDRNLKIKGASSTGVGIVLYDSSDNFRCQLYGEPSNYGFLNGLWNAWDIKKTIGGNLFLNDNTTYYLNPASTTNLNTVNSVSLNGNYIGVSNTTNTNGYGLSLYNGAQSGEPTYGIMFQGTATFGTHGSVTSDWATYFTMNNSDARGWIFRKVGSGNVASVSGGGIITASGDIRAPIFYDSDNTGYYLNPAGLSQLSAVYANDWFRAQGNTGLYFQDKGYGITSAGAASNSYGNASTYGSGVNGWQGWGIGSRHCFMSTGGDNIGIHDNTRSWLYYWDGTYHRFQYGYLQSANSVRGPLFYDSDNTTYYVDPASTGYSAYFAGAIQATKIGIEDAGLDCYMEITDANPTINGVGYGGEFIFYGDKSTAAAYLYYGGATVSYILQANSSLRAPIFYDSNDTNYYIDPNGNSVLNGLYVNAYYNLVNDFKDVYVYGDVNTYYIVLIQGEYIYSYGRYSITRGYNWTGPDTWNTATHKGGLTLDWEWSGDTAWGGNDHAIRIIEFNETYSNMVAGMGYPVNGGIIVWLRGGGVNGAQYRIRTPIGANSTVTVYDGVTATNHSSSTTFTAADSTVFSTRANTSNVSAEIYARYPVRATGSLYNDGTAVLDQSGTSQSKSGILSSAASLRAPIFYDTDNTGYYLDPAGSSNLSAVTADNYYAGGWFRNNSSGNGLYNQSTGEHFYSDSGDMWNIASATTTQGLRLRTGGHNGTIRGYFYADSSNNVGLLNQDGNWRVRVVSGDYLLADGSSIRGQLFYDSNNTSYYIDPASTSNLVGLTVANTITGSITGNAGGSSASCTGNAATATRTSGQSGYPHAGTGMWAFYNWGGSDGGTSAPSASTYTTGLSVGSNPGDQAYGFQIANNMWNTGLWTRNYNSGFGSWIRLLDSSNYVGYSAFTGNVDGTQFRDANNTAYYIDPASTSNLVGLTVANTITGAVSGNAGSVTINYNNDSNSTYQMLWGSGNNVYGTAGVYLNPSTDYVTATSFNASDWFRSSGATGWYNSTYGGGIYMTDTTWVRTYNSKYFYCDTIIQAGSDMRSPVYYDANDTAYYVDAASTSNLLLVKTRNTFGERVAVSATASTTINTQYNVTELTLAATITTLTLSNIQASGTVHMWTIVTVGGGVGYSITWPAAVKWPGGTAPTLTTTSNKRDIYQFVTYDGGTTIFAIIVGQNL